MRIFKFQLLQAEQTDAHTDFGCTLVAAKPARCTIEIIAGEKIKDNLTYLEQL